MEMKQSISEHKIFMGGGRGGGGMPPDQADGLANAYHMSRQLQYL